MHQLTCDFYTVGEVLGYTIMGIKCYIVDFSILRKFVTINSGG